MTDTESGYRDCACRDCFEIAIGTRGAVCHACKDAGCDVTKECEAPGAYGGDVSCDGERTIADLKRIAYGRTGDSS